MLAVFAASDILMLSFMFKLFFSRFAILEKDAVVTSLDVEFELCFALIAIKSCDILFFQIAVILCLFISAAL